MSDVIRIGTRGSALALWQANHVRDELLRLDAARTVELVVIKTRGDEILDRPLAEVGGKGLFVKEIEQALLDGAIDLAVHSLKDMPVEQPEGLELAAFPPRALPWDALCPADAGTTLATLAEGASVGTSSLRRSAQLLRLRPDLRIVSIRGNVGTRLARRRNFGGDLDAVLLAEAGLRRLGVWEDGFESLRVPDFVPAPAQGALALEIRNEHGDIRALVSQLDDTATRLAIVTERACLAGIEGNCHTPFGAYASIDEATLTLHARLLEADGRSTDVRHSAQLGLSPLAAATALGAAIASELLQRHLSALTP